MDPLIPLEVFFGNPERAQPRLSPDGRWISFLADRDGVLNVWVAPARRLDEARPLTRDRGSGIRAHDWMPSGEWIVYPQDEEGNEDWHLYAISPDGGDAQDLTPFQGVSAHVIATSRLHPHRLVAGVNDRVEQLHDPWLLDLATGVRRRLEENPGFAGYLVDWELNLRFAVLPTREGGQQVMQRRAEGWEPFDEVPPEDALTTAHVGFSADGDTLFLVDSRGRDTAALTALRLSTGETRLLAEDPRADVSEVMRDPAEGLPQAVGVTYVRRELRALDPEVEADLARLARLEGELHVVSRTADDRTWLVAETMDAGPVRYHRYERGGQPGFLFSSRPELEQLPLTPQEGEVVRARDGLELVCYLSLPRWTRRERGNRPESPLPMVLAVHGGPWARDVWGYDPVHQWLANRGYAVLSVNFRGSTGFGKSFVNAGNREWGAAMQRDLEDAVRWAVDEGVAEPGRVGIMGGSYGGYAALAGLTFTPELFACAVDIVGPSNLVTLLETIPPYWEPMKRVMHTRVGDPETEEGRSLLVERSPLTHVDRIVRPLLIGQGANDPRVKRAESDQIVAAMRERGIPVTYLLFPDEGHGFARPENRMAFFAVTEAFLARHLGGRSEPLPERFDRSSLQVVEGGGVL